MRHKTSMLIVLLFASAALTGCTSSNKGKLEGTKWSSLTGTVNGGTLEEGAVTLEIGADGTVKLVARNVTITGKYTLESGDRVKIDLDRRVKDIGRLSEKINVSGNQLTMTDPNGQVIRFSKVN